MEAKLKINMNAVTLDCKNPMELAEFYGALLNWEIERIDDEYVLAYNSEMRLDNYPGILFQKNEQYVPPVWPARKGKQQQMAHIDFTVNNLEKAVEHAINCGAVMADEQYSDDWRVLYDPSGHPFCLCL